MQNVTVVPARSRPDSLFLESMRQSVRLVERNGKRIGYVHIWSYAGEQYHFLLERELAQGRLKDADALVLDLRGGWGGAQGRFAELFVGRGPTVTSIDRGGVERVTGFHWRRPVVLLVDSGTRSGKEVVAYGLQRQGVLVVGERSAGAVVQGFASLLADGSLLLVPIADLRVDGERLEGRGITPNHPVPFNLPYAAGNDPQLEAAFALAADAARRSY